MDDITEPARDRWLPDDGRVTRLILCGWCGGTWTAFAVWALWVTVPGSRVFLAALAVAQLTGIVADRT